MTLPVQLGAENEKLTAYTLREAHLKAEHIPFFRAFAVDRCRRWLADRGVVIVNPAQDPADHPVQEAALVLTELLTNVIKHVINQGTCWPAADPLLPHRRDVPDWVQLDLVLEETDTLAILVVVRDGDRRGPMLDTSEPGAFEGGLGLGLVRAVTNDSWGWEPADGGKAVWARCPLTASPN
ncbi:ATP-binding protein [Kitasatospora sp. NPDC058965]|uniref:ATP-binding protein n=1 Tax=Kitasatospora sp. NPDC058965 TaxID=3346682 RepID=UPI00369CB82A